MKVLVTGATGFVGKWLVNYLDQKGLEVSALVRDPKKCDFSPNIQLLKGDVLDKESLIKHFKGQHSVFHLAGVVAYKKTQRKIMDEVNIQGTRSVIEACRENNVEKLLHFSSVAAVGVSFDGKNLLTEESPYNIEHLDLGYFESKHKAEEVVLEAVKKGQIKAVIVNPSTIYGPEDAKKGSRSFQLKVAKGQFPFYPTGGVNIVSIHDVVEGTYLAWQKGKIGERYLLTGENILIKDLFKIIAEEVGIEPPKLPMPKPALLAIGKIGDLLDRFGIKGPISSENAWASVLFHWYDNSKAKKDLGFKARPAREAIAESVQWIKEHGYLK